jgi:hypothetical protein
VVGLVAVEDIAIDGKPVRGTAGSLGPLHSALIWGTRTNLTLEQVATDGKSNQITVIPYLLQLLDLSSW